MRSRHEGSGAAWALLAAAAIGGCSTGDGPVPPSDEPAGRFPPPPRLERAEVWAVGDGADGAEPAARVVRLIARARPDRFVYLGDVYETGTAAEFRDRFGGPYRPLLRITLPTPGNHDWPRHDDGYDPFWARITGRRPPNFYAQRLAGWELLSLNSEEPLDADTDQLRWLRRKVAPRGDCRIAFWHRPRFASGKHGDQRDVEPLWSAVRGRAALVLNGHEHSMQLLRPRSGTTQLVAGSGGHGHYAVNEDDERLAWSNDTDYGALRLDLRPGRARFTFVAEDGRALRSGEVRCSRAS